MKSLVSTALILCMAFGITLAQKNIELTMRYEKDATFGNCYKVYLKPLEAFPGGMLMGPQQVTLVSPGWFVDGSKDIVVLPGGMGGSWAILGGSSATQCNDRNCFTAFASNGAPVSESLDAGQEYLLFQFRVNNHPCANGFRLHDQQLDPIDPDGQSDDFINSMFVIRDGEGMEAYAGNYQNQGTQCAPVVVSKPGVAQTYYEFTVYPNPASEGVRIEMVYEDIVPAEIAFYNNLGQLVYTSVVPEGSSAEYVDFSKTNIESGSYSIRILDRGGETLATETIVVQR